MDGNTKAGQTTSKSGRIYDNAEGPESRQIILEGGVCFFLPLGTSLMIEAFKGPMMRMRMMSALNIGDIEFIDILWTKESTLNTDCQFQVLMRSSKQLGLKKTCIVTVMGLRLSSF